MIHLIIYSVIYVIENDFPSFLNVSDKIPNIPNKTICLF